ncbi:MAG: aminotransferase class I/II-fold pyridoxal phosphate-dependent enzyme, partial [Candidatus Absconditabacterales bacterium]
HVLAYIMAYYPHTSLYTIPGEYEGYEAYGRNLGLEFEVHTLENLLSARPGIIFISNPNASDGAIIPNDIIMKLCNHGHKIVYDITYVGLTSPQLFDVTHPNILAVIASLSKPFGVYYHRIGFCFSRIPIMTLAPNKWFKNINSLLIANKLLTSIKPGQLYEKYKPYQDKAIHTLSQQIGTDISASNILLLGVHKGVLPKKYDTYNRGPNHRFCLTPYFLAQETSTS